MVKHKEAPVVRRTTKSPCPARILFKIHLCGVCIVNLNEEGPNATIASAATTIVGNGGSKNHRLGDRGVMHFGQKWQRRKGVSCGMRTRVYGRPAVDFRWSTRRRPYTQSVVLNIYIGSIAEKGENARQMSKAANARSLL